jgi:hypothetical protein
MPAFAREFLQITRESAYGVKKTTPTRGTDQIAIRLEDGNSFTPRANPVTVPVMYGGGYNVESDTISDKTEVKGSLKTTLCYSQANFLLGMALTKINVGQTLPFVTTEPVNQLVSVWIDHAVWQDDTGAYKRTAYPGMKVDAGSLSTSADAQKVSVSFDLIGSSYQGNTFDASIDPTATEFPQPTDTEYPTDYVLFIHSFGNFKIDTVAWAQFKSLNTSWQCNHVAEFFASRFVQPQRSWGSTPTSCSGQAPTSARRSRRWRPRRWPSCSRTRRTRSRWTGGPRPGSRGCRTTCRWGRTTKERSRWGRASTRRRRRISRSRLLENEGVGASLPP